MINALPKECSVIHVDFKKKELQLIVNTPRIVEILDEDEYNELYSYVCRYMLDNNVEVAELAQDKADAYMDTLPSNKQREVLNNLRIYYD